MKNLYCIGQRVTHDGVTYTVVDFGYSGDANGNVYDLCEVDGDGELCDIPEDKISVLPSDCLRTPLCHASRLAEYAVCGAGADIYSPEQQDFAADCLEAAVHLFRMGKADRLCIAGKKLTDADMLAKVASFRRRARFLRGE